MRAWLWVVAAAVAAGCGTGAKVRVEAVAEEDITGPVKKDAAPPAAKDDATKKAARPDGDGLLGRAMAPEKLPPRLDGPRRAAAAWPPPRSLEPPWVAGGDSGAIDRHPGPANTGKLRPRFAQPAGRDLPDLPPPRPVFDVSPGARVEADDVTVPPPLPLVATMSPDRVPLDDPTAAHSAAAALAAKVPSRDAPAPYLRLATPDPFEHRRPLTVPPAGEATAPPVFTPARP